MRIYRFDTLQPIMNFAPFILERFQGINSLYKDEKKNQYLLLIECTTEALEDYNKVCNIISEYGSLQKVLPSQIGRAQL